MVSKPVRLRERASEDLVEAADYYGREAGQARALEFIDAVEQAVGHVGQSPQIGNLHFAYELNIPDLRVWPVPDFPYLVFYIDTDGVVDVWRVLHSRRDIPGAIRESDLRP